MKQPTNNHDLLQEYIDMYPYRDDENGMDLHSEHNSFREILREIQSRLVPEVEYELGDLYEFSRNSINWEAGYLDDFTYKQQGGEELMRSAKYIRPIQVPDEVSSAITLLEKEGYTITK